MGLLCGWVTNAHNKPYSIGIIIALMETLEKICEDKFGKRPKKSA